MTSKEFLELVQKYGAECAAGGQGYTNTDEDLLLLKIVTAVSLHWKEPKN